MKKATTLTAKPVIYSSKQSIISLVKKHPEITIVDAFTRQLKELFLIEHRKFIGTPKQDVYVSDDYKKYVLKNKKNFCHVYFPWNNTLIKTVTAKNYMLLKTNRNQDLITSEEQSKLADYKVAVLGMSVGSNIAFVLTQAGISNKIIIADFDELDTTNLNRIWAGVHQVGLNKAVIAARRIYEDNPFANVITFTQGINEIELEELLKSGEINCIVEEIDDMQMKINTRKLAIKYKVPVLMVTDNGDWGVLHIERYDLGYNEVFEKELSYWDERMKTYQGKKDFADIVINDIVGGPEKIDPRMLASAKRVVSKELVSWPQLGSAALLGGVAVTYALKRIVRKENEKIFIKEYLFPIHTEK